MDIPESREIRSTTQKSKHRSPWGVHRKAWQIPQLLFFASVQLKSCTTWIWSQYTVRAKYRAEQNLLQYQNSTAPSAGAKQRKWTLATALCSHAQWGAQILPLQAQSQPLHSAAIHSTSVTAGSLTWCFQGCLLLWPQGALAPLIWKVKVFGKWPEYTLIILPPAIPRCKNAPWQRGIICLAKYTYWKIIFAAAAEKKNTA